MNKSQAAYTKEWAETALAAVISNKIVRLEAKLREIIQDIKAAEAKGFIIPDAVAEANRAEVEAMMTEAEIEFGKAKPAIPGQAEHVADMATKAQVSDEDFEAAIAAKKAAEAEAAAAKLKL